LLLTTTTAPELNVRNSLTDDSLIL